MERRFLRGLLYVVAAACAIVVALNTNETQLQFRGLAIGMIAISGLACSTGRGALGWRDAPESALESSRQADPLSRRLASTSERSPY